MGDAIKLVGIVIVIIGFALKFDTLATVVVAGIVTGLVGGMSIMDILSTLGATIILLMFIPLATTKDVCSLQTSTIRNSRLRLQNMVGLRKRHSRLLPLRA